MAEMFFLIQIVRRNENEAPICGRLVGPFDSVGDAEKYADDNGLDETWDVVASETP